MSSSVAQLRARSSAAASTSYRPTTMTPSVGLQRARAPICGGQNDPPRRPRRRRAPPACRCQDPSAPAAAAAAAPAPVVAVEGDVVRVHWSCRDAQSGAVLSCSRGGGAIVASAPRGDVTAGGNGGEDGKDGDGEDGDREPLTFEVGAGCAQNNPIFDAFDDAVRGLPLGGRAEVRAEGGPWDAARLFTVPRAHDEVARLEGRYKSHGGLREGMVVELANGAEALVVALDEGSVRLDTNPMLAGKDVVFELELVGLERGE